MLLCGVCSIGLVLELDKETHRVRVPSSLSEHVLGAPYAPPLPEQLAPYSRHRSISAMRRKQSKVAAEEEAGDQHKETAHQRDGEHLATRDADADGGGGGGGGWAAGGSSSDVVAAQTIPTGARKKKESKDVFEREKAALLNVRIEATRASRKIAS